tara:strand:- start:1591 stop:1779 length:189 start_codon:yes stop_codon:yes gene_type:complete
MDDLLRSLYAKRIKRLTAQRDDLLNALGGMLDHFEDNEQYSKDDATVIKFARRTYNQASGGE